MSVKKIAILGRGSSVDRYRKYSYLFKKIYIVGRFDKEVKRIGIRHFQGKEVVHIISRGCPPLREKFRKILKIKSLQTSCFSIEKEFFKILS